MQKVTFYNVVRVTRLKYYCNICLPYQNACEKQHYLCLTCFESHMVFLISFLRLREQYQLPQTAIKDIMMGTRVLCQDSVKIAEDKVKRRLVNITPEDCDLSNCFDMTDDDLFQDCLSDWLRNQFFNKHFHVVVCMP